MRLLHIDSSILGSHSVSRVLSREIVDAEVRRQPGLKVAYRDLAAQPLDHITGMHLAARQSGTADFPLSVQKDIARGDAALEEFLAADVIVVGTPMYNFTIPSQLKAWIDRLAVAGKTFAYGPDGPTGLLPGKKIIVASSRGGIYSPGAPAAFLDHQETYLKAIFGFMGITDIQFVRAEGVAVADARPKAMEAARAAILGLL